MVLFIGHVTVLVAVAKAKMKILDIMAFGVF
jgi:hypothetical protein